MKKNGLLFMEIFAILAGIATISAGGYMIVLGIVELCTDSDAVVINSLFMMFCGIFFVAPGMIILFGEKNEKNITEEEERTLKYAGSYNEIPCSGDLYLAYFISDWYSIDVKKRNINRYGNIMKAIFLKWIKEKRMTIEERSFGILNKKTKRVIVFKEKTYDKINCRNMINETILLEERLYNHISSNEVVKKETEEALYIIDSESFGNNMVYDINDYMQDIVIKMGYAEKTREKPLILNKYVLTGKYEILKEAEKLAGLKKYLENYASEAGNEDIDLDLLDNYLIFAQMFGIIGSVVKAFEKFYPELMKQSDVANIITSYLH